MTAALLTVEDAADYAGLTVDTLDAVRVLGVGPRTVRVGDRYLYEAAEIDAWRSTIDTEQARTAAVETVLSRVHAAMRGVAEAFA